jgi:translation elongation factor EF-Tu-like GTPase
MAEAKNELENRNEDALDDRGTTVEAGIEMLRRLRDQGFEGDNLKLSVTLGRPVEEVDAWMQGTEPPDDDIIMKARGIAKERGIEIE